MTWFRALLCGLSLGAVASCGSFFPPRPSEDGGTRAGGATGGGFASSGGGGGNTTSDAGLPARVACSVLNKGRCELMRSCGVIEDTVEAGRHCLAWLNATWCGPTKWSAHVEANTLRYDAQKAQGCANDWAARACADWSTEPASCQRIVTPAVSLGGNCYGGYPECAEGVCRGGACPRTCQVRGSTGDACITSSECQATLFCRPMTGSSTASQCAAYSQSGMPCGFGQLCAPGLLCSLGICRPLPLAEQACVQGRCDESAFCVTGTDGGVCEERRTAGAACSDDTQCQPSLLCEAVSQRCVRSLVGNMGEMCSSQQRCPPGGTCLIEAGQTHGVCGAPRRSGEACLIATDCQSQLTCTAADGGLACLPRRPNGSTCSTSRDCLALSVCTGGTCQAQPGLGERCSTTLPCLWGSCLDVADGGSTCIEPQGAGQACRSSADCASERCELAQCTAACLP